MVLPFSFSSELRWSAHRNNMLGPFENGSNLYAVLPDTTNDTIEVWKSTDGGDSWAEQDSGNHQSMSATASEKFVHVIKAGTDLHILYYVSARIRWVVFSLSSDTWIADEAVG